MNTVSILSIIGASLSAIGFLTYVVIPTIFNNRGFELKWISIKWQTKREMNIDKRLHDQIMVMEFAENLNEKKLYKEIYSILKYDIGTFESERRKTSTNVELDNTHIRTIISLMISTINIAHFATIIGNLLLAKFMVDGQQKLVIKKLTKKEIKQIQSNSNLLKNSSELIDKFNLLPSILGDSVKKLGS